ncbi:MAG: hypothetical protein ABR863_13105 [Roseiarcus sp.]|jgi:hypothetical protein
MVLVGVEDSLSEALARRLVAEAGFDLKQCTFTGKRGAGHLKSNLPSYLSAGNRRPVLLLTDLDDVACAPTLVAQWMRGNVMTANFMLRVAVREIEAWLLADRTGIHRFLGIPLRRIASAPEQIADPKMELLSLAKGASAERRRGLVRTEGAEIFRGLDYNHILSDFVMRSWSSERAAANSASLQKALNALTAAKRNAARASAN